MMATQIRFSQEKITAMLDKKMRPSKIVSYRVEQQNKKCIQIMILMAKDPRQDRLALKKQLLCCPVSRNPAVHPNLNVLTLPNFMSS